MSERTEGKRFPSDSDPDEQAAKAEVLKEYPGAAENPYGEPFCRPGLVFAPFVGGWCKIGENWQDAARCLKGVIVL